MSNSLAPIILFVYNRPWHTQQTIEALQKNELVHESDLFIYSDAPKDVSVTESVMSVREYIKTVSGFKSITIIEREYNWGLAANIIDGVTDIVNRYGKIIVLEDDLVTNPYFLNYMNDALEFYKESPNLWHITGYNYPISADELDDTFIWRMMNCWGWATWADRWSQYKKDTAQCISDFTSADIHRLNLDGAYDFWSHLLANRDGKINTWAIYWYATILKNNGLCLSPTLSYIRNIGHDGSGVHCDANDDHVDTILNEKRKLLFSSDIIESSVALEKIQSYFYSLKKPLPIRAINKLSRIISGKNLIR